MSHYVRVADFMTRQLVALSPDMSIADAIALLMQYRISGAPVVSHRKLVGVFSEADCLKELLDRGIDNLESGRVRDYMSTEIDTIGADESVVAAAERFVRQKRRRLPVLDANGTLIGQISRRDVLRAISVNRTAIAPELARVNGTRINVLSL